MSTLTINTADRINAKIFGSIVSGTVNDVVDQDDKTIIVFTDNKLQSRWALPYQIQSINDAPVDHDAITEIISNK